MGFVVDKVALVQVFHRVLRLSPVSIIPSWLSILIRVYRLDMNKISYPLAAAVQK
jgi:hypothetical protein